MTPEERAKRTILKTKIAIRTIAVLCIFIGLVTNTALDVVGLVMSLAVIVYELIVEKETE